MAEQPSRLQIAVAWLAVAGFVLAFVWQGLACIDASSQSFDESVHLAAGYSYLVTGDFRLNREHPPLVKLLCAAPIYLVYRPPFEPAAEDWERADEWRIGRQFLYESSVAAESMLRLARLVTLGLGVLLLLLIGWWAYRLWGPAAGVAAVGLAAFEPNLVANACVVSFDLTLALLTCLTFYLLWEYVQAPSPKLLIGIGVSLGLVLGTKLSGPAVVGILLAVIGLHLLNGGTLGDSSPGQSLGQRARQAATPLRRMILLALLTLVPLYFVVSFPAWGEGFRYQLGRVGGGGNPGFFFLGEVSSKGWLTYFPVAFLLKTPVGSLFLVGLSLVGYRLGTPLRRPDILFLLVPALLFLLAMMIIGVNNGVRQILPVYPFLLIAASRLATIRPGGRWGLVVPLLLIGVPLTANAVSVLRQVPQPMAYFNELIGGPDQGHHYLGNSNLGWGQDLKALRRYMDDQGLDIIYLAYQGTAPPAAYGIRAEYLPSFNPGMPLPAPPDRVPADAPRHILAISLSNLQGTNLPDLELYRWLLERQPVDRVGSLFIYDLTNDREALQRVEALHRMVVAED